MNPSTEIYRLRELMPATGRMLVKISSQPQQAKVLETPFPLPWKSGTRPIYINFDLWQRLSTPQRDLLLLRSVSWVLGIQWFKADWQRGVALAGIVGSLFELSQGDAVGVLVAGGLSAIALRQIWRSNRSAKTEIDADEAAIKVAQRRGYSAVEAAEALLETLESVAKLEGRSNLNFTELIRAQNLRAIANLSPIGVPEQIRRN
ncbi:DUF3318 domain-containing protein [Lusitaniella coriacea]|uniref:DUF3318 domain-containing protein n=1 Tax=Lusitaniella coriacea TaxID=1983105 RepID=UPI003CE888A1